MTKQLLWIVVALTMFAGVLAAPAGASAAQSMQVVNLGSAISPEMLLPVLVAEQKGCYAAHGIDFHFKPLGGPNTRDALAAGDINFALFHVAPMWIAVQKGLPFRFVSMFYTREIFGMLAAESLKGHVKDIRELKGMRGMTAVPGSASYAATTFFLQHSGLNPSADVQMTYVASTDPKIWLNAITSGRVQFLGGVWEPVFSIAVGKHIAFPIFDPAELTQQTAMYGGEVSTLGLVTTTSTIKSNRPLVKKMVACVNAGLAALPNESDGSLVDTMRTEGHLNIDRADLLRVIRRIRGNYEPNGRPSKSKYARAVAAYVKAGYLKKDVPYNAVIDSSFAGSAP